MSPFLLLIPGAASAGSGGAPVPVSYTHLDVYKRQDGSRLWDKETLEKMDKDRFRQSLGGLIEAYEAGARRLGVQLD